MTNIQKFKLAEIDLCALKMYHEELIVLEAERRNVLLTMQVIDLLLYDGVIYPRETVSNLRLYFKQEIHKTVPSSARKLELARSYIGWLLKENIITRHMSIVTLCGILEERFSDISL